MILGIEDLELPPVPKDEVTEDEVSDVWGHRIRTDKGICTVEMRVDHNGYYGGELAVTLSIGAPGCQEHEDCRQYPELGAACKPPAMPGTTLDDF